jgi:hypothetical protein
MENNQNEHQNQQGCNRREKRRKLRKEKFSRRNIWEIETAGMFSS